MKTRLLIAVAAFILASSAFCLDLSIPDEVPGYKDLELSLQPGPGESISQARFYFLQEKSAKPLYADFELREGVWTATIPFKYLAGEELEYYLQVRSAQGRVSRFPESGVSKARLIQDQSPPSLFLEKPAGFLLEKGKEQEVRFRISDESIISDFKVRYDGVAVEESVIYMDRLYMILDPPADSSTNAVLTVTVIDYFGNRTEKDFTFLLEREKAPRFAIENELSAKAKLTYGLALGESAATTDIKTLFSDATHDPTLEYEVRGRIQPDAGPLSLDLGVLLSDSVSLFEIGEACPNSLIADFQNYATLLNPWNFEREFDWSGQVAREYDNDNRAWAKVSLFDPFILYAFGDQEISFQKQTVRDFDFRGHSLSFRIPGLALAAAKGLSDPGLYGTSWPRTFAAIEAGIQVQEYFWFKANLALISSLQGRYEALIVPGASSPTGMLYGLASVRPEENLVLGFTTGSRNPLFTLEAGAGFTLYNDDAGEFLDLDSLASELDTAFDIDMKPYIGTIDRIEAVFPVLDYFPVTKGLVAGALSRDLWGLSLGADLKIPKPGLEAWVHATDAAYKSLAASVDTDQMKAGTSWNTSLRDFDIAIAFEWKKDNIPDILFNNLLPLVSSDFTVTASPVEDDISTISHAVEASLQTPSAGARGSVKFSWKSEAFFTNAAELAESVGDDAAARDALLDSVRNDSCVVHTGGVQWRSGRIRAGKSILGFGLKTEDSYTLYSELDGAESSLAFWDLSFGIDAGIQRGRSMWTHAYTQTWNTKSQPEMKAGYMQKLTVSKGWLDRLTWSIKGNLGLLDSVLQRWDAGSSLSIEKTFGMLLIELSAEASYLDSLVSDADDRITARVNLSGSFEF
jgi:hypothetical protein